MKAAICDDEPIFLEFFQKQLEKALNDCEIKCSVSAYQNSVEMLNHVGKYDIIFLDVDMPHISGEDIAAYIKGNKIQPLIIFVTNHDDFVYSSFQYRPFEFIRKKYISFELPTVIQEIKEFFDRKNEVFICTSHGNKIYTKYSDILFFESYSHEIVAHTVSSEIHFNEPLSKLEKRLSPKGFIRTHSSFLVNCDHIFSVEKDRIILNTNDTVPLSRKRVNEVKHKMMIFLRR